MKNIFLALLVFALLIPAQVVYADGCQPPSVENCPRPPGHEKDEPAEPNDEPKDNTRPPGHEKDKPAPVIGEPEYLCYPFMGCWQ